jgi:hypothetical protein
MFVCCVCCVLSGRGLCDELITRPEKSYRHGVSCVIKNPRGRGHIPRWAAEPERKKISCCVNPQMYHEIFGGWCKSKD